MFYLDKYQRRDSKNYLSNSLKISMRAKRFSGAMYPFEKTLKIMARLTYDQRKALLRHHIRGVEK